MRKHKATVWFLLAGGIFWGLAGEGRSQEVSDRKPNVVFILADDLGYGDVGAFNPDSKIPTPQLDRLAAQGMIFTDAHAPAAICSPTRYALLTGRYAWRTGLKGVLEGKSQALIKADEMTVATLLRRAGYHTACIGKWHLGMPPTGDGRVQNGPLSRGFDFFFGFQFARGIEDLVLQDRFVAKQAPITILPTLGAKAEQYLEERAKEQKPFFLYLPLNAPHTPVVPTAEFRGRTKFGPYGDFVVQADAVVGQVMSALQKHKLSENTLVCFASDNGSPHAAAKGHQPNFIWRGKKATIYEGGQRVPFLASWPGRIPAGAKNAATICHVDLLATCADLVQTKLPEDAGVDSVSFLPCLLGAKESRREATVLHDGHNSFALRQGRWVLILAGAAKKKAAGDTQLYDLEKDPRQTQDVKDQHPEVVERLHGILASYVARGRSTPGPKRPNDVNVQLPALKKGLP